MANGLIDRRRIRVLADGRRRPRRLLGLLLSPLGRHPANLPQVLLWLRLVLDDVLQECASLLLVPPCGVGTALCLYRYFAESTKRPNPGDRNHDSKPRQHQSDYAKPEVDRTRSLLQQFVPQLDESLLERNVRSRQFRVIDAPALGLTHHEGLRTWW